MHYLGPKSILSSPWHEVGLNSMADASSTTSGSSSNFKCLISGVSLVDVSLPLLLNLDFLFTKENNSMN